MREGRERSAPFNPSTLNEPTYTSPLRASTTIPRLLQTALNPHRTNRRVSGGTRLPDECQVGLFVAKHVMIPGTKQVMSPRRACL